MEMGFKMYLEGGGTDVDVSSGQPCGLGDLQCLEASRAVKPKPDV